MLALTLSSPLGDHDLRVHVLRGGSAAVTAGAEVLAQGKLTGPAGARGSKLALSLGGAAAGAGPPPSPAPLLIPMPGEREAEQAAEDVNAAARLEATVLTVKEAAAMVDPNSPLLSLEPLRHITDLDGLGPGERSALLQQLEEPGPLPAGYIMAPLPEGTFVMAGGSARGVHDLAAAMPGPLPVVVWRRESRESSESSPHTSPAARAKDLAVLASALRAGVAGATPGDLF